MNNVDQVFSELKRKEKRMTDNELLQQIASDLREVKTKVNIIEEQVGRMQEQLTRIEDGQKLLAGDVFDHKVRLLSVEKKAK